MSKKTKIAEIFSSIQGEALYVGCRQVFVRFCGCNIRCGYCDTMNGLSAQPYAKIEKNAGSRDFLEVKNPITVEQLAEYVNTLLMIPHHSVSLTGGEPLCQAEFITQLAPLIKAPLYLETNGTLPEKLAMVLPYIDIVSMDIKLPSVTNHQEYWYEHEQFLKLAHTCKEVFVKIVICRETECCEFEHAVDIIKDIDAAIPLVLQPVTPSGGYSGVNEKELIEYQSRALSTLKNVRVIPQIHKILGCI